MVRFGFRVPSLKKRISARTSLKRYARNNLGFKAPRGWGWLTNPRKAAYNRVYNRTTRGCLVLLGVWVALVSAAIAVAAVMVKDKEKTPMNEESPIPRYVPQEDDDSGSPLVDALNRFSRGVPTLHDPTEVQAFIKSVDGLPDAGAQIEKFILGIAARYEQWHRENDREQN